MGYRKSQSIRSWLQQTIELVTALALSPDGSRLAAEFDDGTIKLWNTDQTEQPIATHKHHSSCVSALAFSPDGQQLASVSWDKSVRFWDGGDGSTTNVIEHVDWLQSVAISSDLFAAAAGKDITIWNRKTLHLIDTISLGSLSLSFSDAYGVRLSSPVGSSSLLAIACQTNTSSTSTVIVWHMGERTILGTFQVNAIIRKLTPSLDGARRWWFPVIRCFHGEPHSTNRTQRFELDPKL